MSNNTLEEKVIALQEQITALQERVQSLEAEHARRTVQKVAFPDFREPIHGEGSGIDILDFLWNHPELVDYQFESDFDDEIFVAWFRQDGLVTLQKVCERKGVRIEIRGETKNA